MTTIINVGIMGFSPREESKFNKIFELSQQHERAYKLCNINNAEPVEMLIVKKADDWRSQQQSYQEQHKNKHRIPVVMVGREAASNEDTYYIRGVLIPSRVFEVLDKIEISAAMNEIIAEAEANNPQTTKAADITETIDAQADALQVLVVDDSVMMQKTVQLELNKATIPLSVDLADTGEMALEKVKLKKYDFIFLDVMMPGIDGFETCSQIRKLDGMAKTPIIMLTSKTSAMDEVKGLMAGCTTYLTKPFEHDEFHKMLERIVQWVKEFNDKK